MIFSVESLDTAGERRTAEFVIFDAQGVVHSSSRPKGSRMQERDFERLAASLVLGVFLIVGFLVALFITLWLVSEIQDVWQEILGQ